MHSNTWDYIGLKRFTSLKAGRAHSGSASMGIRNSSATAAFYGAGTVYIL